ncbi:hypothetical protein HAX54_002484 [Datura stramonium]|uniref:Uncharacterized protein n=1 Tax=Datura stramonium TaxID=4076 RepID=A0ABS8T4Q0_DATST|nr:hypothetical protein [Datura stramonium]
MAGVSQIDTGVSLGVLTRVGDSMAVREEISVSNWRIIDRLPAYPIFCLSSAGGWCPMLLHWNSANLAPVTPHPYFP